MDTSWSRWREARRCPSRFATANDPSIAAPLYLRSDIAICRHPLICKTPVDLAIVAADAAHMSPVIKAIVRMQAASGMRPSEVASIRPCDIAIREDSIRTSRRTLFYAFNDLLDFFPRAYTKRVRLEAARRMISDNRDQRCVQRVARELGFVHEGQFSIDYASAFGESPSKTRNRLLRR